MTLIFTTIGELKGPTAIRCKAKHLRQRLDALHAVADARQDIDPNAPGYTPGLSKEIYDAAR